MVMFLTSTLSAAIMLGGHGDGGGGYLLHHLTRLSPEMISDLATAAMMKPSLVVVTRILSQIWSQLHRFALIAL